MMRNKHPITPRPEIRGARALMAERKESHDSLDFFPTPPWATRALMEYVLPHVVGYKTRLFGAIWEPACGEGHMSDVLEDYSDQRVFASDIHDYGGNAICDFLTVKADVDEFEWIITNPPYTKTTEFALRGMSLASVGVAIFARVQFLETVGRYERLFRDSPPTLIAFFSERVPIHKGKWNPQGSTATAYCWLAWVKGRKRRAPYWIPPGCRQSLTRPNDRARFAAWSLGPSTGAQEAAQ